MATTSTINEKIAHLLALASNNPSEAEAKAALLKARELMAKHKLRPEDCKKSENVRVIRELVGVECTAMTNPWAVSLSAVIAEHYCCCSYRNRYTGRKVNTIGFVGLEDDFEICKRVFLYAYDCVMSVLKRDIERNSWDEPGAYRKRCNAYGWGFVSGVKAAFAEQEKEHQEWALVLKVPQQVTQSMADMGKPSQFGKVQSEGYLAGYRARGYQDGTKFDPSTKLSGGRELTALEG